MKTKTFYMPKNPRTQVTNKIVVEKPSPKSVWYLVIDEEKAKPLPNLKNPTSAKQILDNFGKTYSEDNVAQYIYGGYSNIKAETPPHQTGHQRK